MEMITKQKKNYDPTQYIYLSGVRYIANTLSDVKCLPSKAEV